MDQREIAERLFEELPLDLKKLTTDFLIPCLLCKRYEIDFERDAFRKGKGPYCSDIFTHFGTKGTAFFLI